MGSPSSQSGPWRPGAQTQTPLMGWQSWVGPTQRQRWAQRSPKVPGGQAAGREALCFCKTPLSMQGHRKPTPVPWLSNVLTPLCPLQCPWHDPRCSPSPLAVPGVPTCLACSSGEARWAAALPGDVVTGCSGGTGTAFSTALPKRSGQAGCRDTGAMAGCPQPAAAKTAVQSHLSRSAGPSIQGGTGRCR